MRKLILTNVQNALHKGDFSAIFSEYEVEVGHGRRLSGMSF
jgi:hypothetical protein